MTAGLCDSGTDGSARDLGLPDYMDTVVVADMDLCNCKDIAY